MKNTADDKNKKTNPRMNPEKEDAMKNTMTAKGLLIAWIGIVALVGCAGAANAADLELKKNNAQTAAVGNEGQGNLAIVTTIAGACVLTPYVTAPFIAAMNCTVCLFNGVNEVVMPGDRYDNPGNETVRPVAIVASKD
jgi:hypothetical protein